MGAGRASAPAALRTPSSPLFSPFSDVFVPILFLKKRTFIQIKKKLRHLLILADARSQVFDPVASKQSVTFSL